METAEGFQIEDPQVFVPWGISTEELVDLLPTPPRRVTGGYYTISCTSLGGLRHELGFHFRPRREGRLRELEFFRTSYLDVNDSFEEFQRHLLATFGEPAQQFEGDQNLPGYTWKLGPAQIQHYVFDRFGPEEHVRIRLLGVDRAPTASGSAVAPNTTAYAPISCVSRGTISGDPWRAICAASVSWNLDV